MTNICNKHKNKTAFSKSIVASLPMLLGKAAQADFYLPIQLCERNIGALSFIGLKVHTRLETIHFKCLKNHSFCIKI